jgi:uncharacterized membrane protein
MAKLTPNIRKFLRVFCAIALVVVPIGYAMGGWMGLAFGVVFGLINGLGPRADFVQAAAMGLVAAATLRTEQPFLDRLLFASVASFAVGFANTVAKESEVDRRRLLAVASVGFVLGGVMGAGLFLSESLVRALPSTAALALAAALCVTVGALLGLWLRPRLLKFGDVWLYLREMGTFLVGFVMGYFAIALLFAGWFWSAWRVRPADSFNNLPAEATFGDFFYFSVVTLATLGYGDITPKSGVARALVLSEVVLGVGWITVVFAAVMAHLQPRLAEVAKRKDPPPPK